MLDKNFFAESYRNCPENEKIPVCKIDNSNIKMGGCSNVAKKLKELGHDVNLISYVGNDKDGDYFISQLNHHKINTDLVLRCNDKLTIVKNRIFLKNDLIFRFDNECNLKLQDFYIEEIKLRINNILKFETFDLIVISDYDKGLITNKLMNHINEISIKYSLKIIVDLKPSNINFYINSYLLKPNLNELSIIANKKVDLDNLLEVSREVSNKYNINYLVTSLAKNGIFMYDKSNNNGRFFNEKYVSQDEVIDVTGAGDIVLSYLAHYVNDVTRGCIEANKKAQDSVKYIGVSF